jgi:hypothetical protein
MEILLHDRTTNQPRAVHSGRGGKSIAHDGWEAKSIVTSIADLGRLQDSKPTC